MFSLKKASVDVVGKVVSGIASGFTLNDQKVAETSILFGGNVLPRDVGKVILNEVDVEVKGQE